MFFFFLQRLESASRKLELSGPQGVTIESRAGDITVSCLMDVKLQSIAGAVRIQAIDFFVRFIFQNADTKQYYIPRIIITNTNRRILLFNPNPTLFLKRDRKVAIFVEQIERFPHELRCIFNRRDTRGPFAVPSMDHRICPVCW